MAVSTIAIMQPYFLPYAGYFRLFSASELFVIYDCVQFPRRGWVHRNRFLDHSGNECWLTLPLDKAPQDVLIRDLRFASNAAELLSARLRPFSLAAKDPESAAPILDALRDVSDHPVDYIVRLLERTVAYLGLRWSVVRSSSLRVPGSFRGQDRILEIARRLGARRYVNAPGGRGLYDPEAFAKSGIELSFLVEYTGSTASVLARILREQRADLVRELACPQVEVAQPRARLMDATADLQIVD
jgi:hypothetical protein